ncbi:MAG: hypothetical protein P1U80_12435 [Pseudomonadales bacterium]|nr:hypothetical protein [Pseudomonadales bacterium]
MDQCRRMLFRQPLLGLLFLAGTSGVCAQRSIQLPQDRFESLEEGLNKLKQKLNSVASKSELSSVKSAPDYIRSLLMDKSL